VPDTRHKRGRRYEIGLVLTLLLLAKLAGEQTIAAATQWVLERQTLLAQWLPLLRCPCANTYRNICAGVDANALLQAVAGVLNAATASTLVAQVVQLAQVAPAAAAAVLTAATAAPCLRHLACDGKARRGSQRLMWHP
jgi:hypothetical protein